MHNSNHKKNMIHIDTYDDMKLFQVKCFNIIIQIKIKGDSNQHEQ